MDWRCALAIWGSLWFDFFLKLHDSRRVVRGAWREDGASRYVWVERWADSCQRGCGATAYNIGDETMESLIRRYSDNIIETYAKVTGLPKEFFIVHRG